MTLSPMEYDAGWIQNIAIWGTVMGAVVVVAIVWGIVMIVRAVSNRNRAPAGGRTCKSCGMMVNPGNPTCPTCKAQMDWS